MAGIPLAKECKDRGISPVNCHLHGTSCLSTKNKQLRIEKIENISTFLHKLLDANPQLATRNSQHSTLRLL